MVDKSDETKSDGATTATSGTTAATSQAASTGPREVIVHLTREFQYRGANFEGDKYYRVRDEPANFIDWHIVHNANGQVVDSPPEGAEILDDPRPAAMAAVRDREAAEQARIVQAQAPRAPIPRASAPGMATVATTRENVFGGEHTAQGFKPATGPTPQPSGAASTSAPKSGETATDRPRLPKTA